MVETSTRTRICIIKYIVMIYRLLYIIITILSYRRFVIINIIIIYYIASLSQSRDVRVALWIMILLYAGDDTTCHPPFQPYPPPCRPPDLTQPNAKDLSVGKWKRDNIKINNNYNTFSLASWLLVLLYYKRDFFF